MMPFLTFFFRKGKPGQMSGSTITTLGDYTLIGAPMWVDKIQETRGKVTVVNNNNSGEKNNKNQFEMIPCGVCKYIGFAKA